MFRERLPDFNDVVRRDDFYQYLLIIAGVTLFLFAHAVEGIGLRVWLSDPLNALWRVARHFAPAMLGWTLAQRAAVGLVYWLYDLSDDNQASQFLTSLKTGAGGGSVSLTTKTLPEGRDSSVLLRLGGPGRISVDGVDVVVTEKNGRYNRTLGSGTHALEPFEYVQAVIDVRPRERERKAIRLMTQDGIQMQVDVTIIYRLHPGDQVQTRANPYPFDPEAARKAAYTQIMLPKNYKKRWEDVTLDLTEQQLTSVIAKYRLDEILHPLENSASEPQLTILNELRRNLGIKLQEIGVQLVSLHLSRPELPPDVTKQYIAYWQAHWQISDAQHEARTRVSNSELLEEAQSDAELKMLEAIVAGLALAEQKGQGNQLNNLVTLRLVEALEKVTRQASTENSKTLLPTLQALRQQQQLAIPATLPPPDDDANNI